MSETSLKFVNVLALYKHLKASESLSAALPIIASIDLFARGDKNILLQRLSGLKNIKGKTFDVKVEGNQSPYMIIVS